MKCIWNIRTGLKTDECPVVHPTIESMTTNENKEIAQTLCRFCPILEIYIAREVTKCG